MRRIVLVVAVLSSLAIVSTASAAQSRTTGSQANAARKGPVAKLVDLEKRKNEWLRQQFLGK
jgi:hypothetical protein